MRILLLIAASFLYYSVFCQTIDVHDRPRHSERERTFDALHYRIQLRLDLDKKTYIGENRISFIPLTDRFSICWLDASEMEVTGVVNGGGESLKYKHDGDRLRIKLNRSYSRADTVTLTVQYNGQDPSDGLFFDDASENHPKMVSSNSWPDHARYWFPCYDAPNDKVTHEVIATVKKPLKVLSNGRLISVRHNEESGEVTYHWYQEKPHSTYLSMLAIGPFSVIEDSLDNLTINHWVYPGDEENAQRIFACTPGAIAYFNNLFGVSYPWAKYDHVIGPRQGGGAEATSATILGLGVIHDPAPDLDANWERIIAHEAAHQWWGDLVTLRTWSETWLNEGFATYFDHMYVAATRGEDEGAVDLLVKKMAYLNEAGNRYIRPIVFDRYNRIEDNFDNHTYQKAAANIHLLRHLLGDDDFYRILKSFLQEYAFKSVDTENFIATIQSAADKDMRWFFDQCFYRPGHPVFEIESTWDSTVQVLTMSIRQVQDTTTGTPVFKLPVTIGIIKASGEKVSEKVWIEEQEELFQWQLDGRPKMVRFDEGNILLKEWTFEKEPEELLFQLQNDDVIGRMWAAGELNSYMAISYVEEALIHAARNDPFWSVREAAIESLSNAGKSISGDLLKELMKDPHYKVQRRAKAIFESQIKKSNETHH